MGEAEGVDPGRKGPRLAVVGVGKLMIVVACFGVIFWAAVSAWERARPSRVLIRSLHSSSVVDRRAAAQQLGEVAPEEVLASASALTGSLQDPDEEVRYLAANGLVRLLTAATSPKEFDHAGIASALGPAVGDGSHRVRDRALITLLVIAKGSPIAPPAPLPDLLTRSESASTRAKVAAVLPSFRLDRAATVSRLTSALKDREPEVIQAVASALGEMGPEAVSARPALIAILKRSEEWPPSPAGQVPNSPAIAAARAIGAISSDPASSAVAVAVLEETLRAGPKSCRSAAAEALYRMGGEASPATPTLIATLQAGVRPDGGEGFESWAARALGGLAPGTAWAAQTIQGLIQGLDAKTSGMRGYSAQALGEFGAAATIALPRLREVERGKDPFAAGMASKAIKKIEAKSATP